MNIYLPKYLLDLYKNLLKLNNFKFHSYLSLKLKHNFLINRLMKILQFNFQFLIFFIYMYIILKIYIGSLIFLFLCIFILVLYIFCFF